AVRAGLRILEAIEATDRGDADRMRVRVGVNTGEAVVMLAPGVQVGENIAGDVVNTAARLQAAAAPGTLVVGEPTYRATSDAVTYEELRAVLAKGKSDPLRVWRALEIRALPTISEREANAP